MKKDKRVIFRATAKEVEKLNQLAKKQGLTVSEFIRKQTLGK